jgi:hypothetical protein
MRTAFKTRIITGAIFAIAAAPTASKVAAQDVPTAVVVSPSPMRPLRGPEAIEKFIARVPPTFDGGECRTQNQIPMAAHIVSMKFPTQQAAQTSVSIWLDEDGEVFRYIESSGGGPRSHPNLDSLVAQQARAPRTAVQLDIKDNHAIASNQGGGLPDEGVVGTVAEFANSKRFHYLQQRMEAVLKACVGGSQ